MGQFYESTAGRFVDDKMFQAPHQLMQAIIQNKDKAVDTEIASAVSLYDKLTADVLQQDNPRAKEVISGYETKINDIVSEIQKNPLEYNKYSRDVRMMGRDIHKDWTLGEVGTMQKNKKELVDYYTQLDELHKKDPEQYDAAYIQAMKGNALKDYKEGLQYNSGTGVGNKIATDEASALPNLFDKFSKSAEKMTADGYKIEKDVSGNGYIYIKGTERKQLTKEKLLEAFASWAKGQDSANTAIGQRKQLGLEGFADADINDIIKYGKDKDGNTIMTGVSDNYYGKNARAIANTYFSDWREETIDKKNDSLYNQRQQQAYDDAKEKVLELPETQFDRVYGTDAGDIKTFAGALDTTNKALNEVQTQAGQSAVQVGIQPGSAAYKAIQNGNFAALRERFEAKGVPTGVIDDYESKYRQNHARKEVLNAQNIAFASYAKKNNLKDAEKIGTQGWTSNPQLQKAYKQFVDVSNIKQTKVVPLTVSLNNLGFTKDLVKSYQDVLAQNIDNLVWKIEGTAKGQEEVRETMDGNKIIYTADKAKHNQVVWQEVKDKGGKVTGRKGTRYYYVPDGKLTVGRMIQDGVLQREISETQEVDADGVAVEGKNKLVGFSNGKKIGFDIDNKTVGLVSGYDDAGKANLATTAVFGNNRGTLTFDSNQLTSPTLRQGIQARQSDFEFDKLDAQTNWHSLAPITKIIDGHEYTVKGGEAYADGVRLNKTNEIRAVKKLILGY